MCLMGTFKKTEYNQESPEFHIPQLDRCRNNQLTNTSKIFVLNAGIILALNKKLVQDWLLGEFRP